MRHCAVAAEALSTSQLDPDPNHISRSRPQLKRQKKRRDPHSCLYEARETAPMRQRLLTSRTHTTSDRCAVVFRSMRKWWREALLLVVVVHRLNALKSKKIMCTSSFWGRGEGSVLRVASSFPLFFSPLALLLARHARTHRASEPPLPLRLKQEKEPIPATDAQTHSGFLGVHSRDTELGRVCR